VSNTEFKQLVREFRECIEFRPTELKEFRERALNVLKRTGHPAPEEFCREAEIQANTEEGTHAPPKRPGFVSKLRQVEEAEGVNLVGVDWAKVDFSPVQWLWDGKIPLGHLTLLAGRGGTGKSTVMIDVAARVSRGRDMPDGSPGVDKGTTLLIDAENGPRLTGPRLKAADADLARIQFVDAPEINFQLKHVEQLRRGVERYQPSLVVVDPLAAMVEGVDMHKEGEVRNVLKYLQRLAEEFGIALVIIAHLRKMQADHAQDMVAGSAGIVNAARHVLMANTAVNADIPEEDRTQDDWNRRELFVVKTNITELSNEVLYYWLRSAADSVCIGWSPNQESEWTPSQAREEREALMGALGEDPALPDPTSERGDTPLLSQPSLL
jgi:RecA/RadA recombinase